MLQLLFVFKYTVLIQQAIFFGYALGIAVGIVFAVFYNVCSTFINGFSVKIRNFVSAKSYFFLLFIKLRIVCNKNTFSTYLANL